jgi:hypothetical protein
MIPRRIAEHVKAHNWFAVAIDFVIVVIGVFVGIQVSNWNAAQADKARAHGYLTRIADDLKFDLATYANRMEFWRKVSDYGSQALANADGGSADARPWEALLAFFQASQVAEFFTTETTYEELKSAGELALIADTGLRVDLAQYYSLGANPAMSERPDYREHVRGKIPLDVQTYIWNECYSSDSKGRQTMRACKSPISDADAAAIVDGIRSDAALIAELRYWMSTMHVASLIGRDRAANATEILAAVERELANRR